MVKRSKIITQQPKTIKRPKIVDIKPVIIEHPRTLYKLSKAIRQAEKVSEVSGTGKTSDSPLYSEMKKVKFFCMKKNAKIRKQFQCYKGYASTNGVGISNSFNRGQQLNDTEYAIRNRLIDLLTE